jgi:DNA-binding transcriptional LysR family regulator
MDIRQLETFLWISRLGSVTAACKRLNVTQSTLSMRLKELESTLGVRLFDRLNRSLALTAKGRELVEYAETIVATVKQMRDYVEDPTAASGTIRVGISELIALTFTPQLIRRFSSQYANVTLDLDIGAPRPMLGALANGELDVVLMPTLSRPDASDFDSVPLGSVEFSWMASPALVNSTPALRERVVTPKHLEGLTVIGTASSQSIFYAAIEAWFKDEDAQIRRYSSCNSLATYASLVMGGLGVSLLPQDYFAPFIEAGKLRILRTSRDFKFDYYAVCRASDNQTLPRELIACAQSTTTFQ